ncbi:Spaf_1101 family AAA-like ATPase [Bacillus sp. z60-18]|uniref:Spaf_1101 family AAA-like ATPase n=1 Tax=unclassified Bacillus (in: firmicutes) TaxID=185979 RepID=UPI00390CA7E3
MSEKDFDYINNVYQQIKNQRARYGTLKRCEFHIHTPASYDYKMYKNLLYEEMTAEQIINVALEVGYINTEIRKKILENINHYKSDSYRKELKEKSIPYYSFKEYLAYQLIAHSLYQKNIEVAIISDHNTISGYSKLKYALEEYFSEKIKGKDYSKKSICLFLGVEISCSEKNHLIAIFDEKNIEKVESFLNEIIMSKEGGTYYTSQNVIEQILNKKLDAIIYLAHLNSSDFLGSSTYNNTLFTSNKLDVFGLTQLNAKDRVYDRISNYNKKARKKFGIIHEGDSHSIDTLGDKNTWIKFSNMDFSSLKKAIKNHRINVYTEKPEKPDKFIKGLLVYPGKDGFLRGNNETPFVVDFSRDLNCIIGGRGTGKSTLLNMIECAFCLETDDFEKLKMISKHERIYIVFYLEGDNYVLEFIPQIKNKEEEYYIDDPFIKSSYLIDNSNGKKKIKLNQNWITLYKKSSEKIEKLKYKDAQEILSKAYRRGYSINNIINEIDRGEVGAFVKGTILNNFNNEEIQSFIYQLSDKRRNFPKFLREKLQIIINEMGKRKERINEILKEFNIKYSPFLKIIYSPKINNTDEYLKELLDIISREEYVNKQIRLTWNDVANYIYQFSKKEGFLKFLSLLFNLNYKELDNIFNLSSIVSNNRDFKDIDKDLIEISDEYSTIIFEAIRHELLIRRELLETSIKKWFEVFDDFTIHFNINMKESSIHQKPLMKDINEMSLGQKVAAILSFVFNYGYFTNDNTPLIIDQPEDNLDNQYIYKNLVESLRQIKNNRQVIIVTHNSTIVTNADTEQVIVLNSDNEHGWIEKKGYPTDKKITKLIINYLEGGIDSFKHKIESYTLFLKELSKNVD